MKADAKGRMSIPAAFRRVIEAQIPGWSQGQPVKCVLMQNADRRPCLQFYGQERFKTLEKYVDRLPQFSKKHKKLARKFGSAHDLLIDDSGRVVLSEKFRAKVGVAAGVPLIGVGMVRWFELWTADNYALDEDDEGWWNDDEEDPTDVYRLIEEIEEEARLDRVAQMRLQSEPRHE